MSPNFNDRKSPISFLILHYTGMQSAEAALSRLCDPQSEVSAHYFINEAGEVISLVPEEKRAWHAGISYWKGIQDINSASIGVELVNPGHEHGYKPFPEAQMKALVSLAHEIILRHDIKPQNVLGHSDIAPSRKVDPGELLDWAYLARKNIGLWPDERISDMAGDRATRIKEELCAFGYDPSCDEKTLITAFQRHYHPTLFDMPELVGHDNEETRRRLRVLLKQSSS